MKELGVFQKYLIEEFVEDWREGHLSRRELVRRTAYVTGGVASAATVLVSMGCAPAATPTAIPTTAPLAPTAAAPTVAPPPSPTTAPATPAATKPAAAGDTPAATTAAAASPAAAATKPGAPAGATKPAGAGPAAGSGPRSPLSVRADDPAVQAMEVQFPGEAGTVFGYLAKPTASGSYAGLIVIHENRGLVPHIEDVTRRAAKEGYIALAVDLLSRNGGTKKVTDPAQIGGMLGQAKPEDLVADLGAGVKYLQSQAEVKQDKVGAFGFCFGGGYTWRLAVANKEISAAVPFYGPAPPLDQVPNMNAAVLGIYAENDQRINRGIPALEEALKQANKTYQIKIYPGVNHAFHNDTGANWNEAAATDAWQNAMLWFRRHLT